MNEFVFKVKRKIAQNLAKRRFLGDGPGGAEKTSLVLYFDYEREFGNPLAGQSAEAGFRGVLETLGRHGVRGTWNCVGLLADHYPATLHELVRAGQELASHTYHHIDLVTATRKELVAELVDVRERFSALFAAEVVGLHPPRDRWSMRLPALLRQHGYRYLIARDDSPSRWHAHYLKFPLGPEIFCIPSVADDWGYISDRLDSESMHRLWMDRLTQARPGSVVALGFHPWVLGADAARLKGFAALVGALAADGRYRIVTAREVLEWYES